MTYRILTGAHAAELRIGRILTLEKRRFSIGLEAEEIGGLNADMVAEVEDIDRRIELHAAVVWPERGGEQSGGDDADDSDSGETTVPPGFEDERDELGARAHLADGPHPDDPAPDPRTELPDVLGHEEDDVAPPGADVTVTHLAAVPDLDHGADTDVADLHAVALGHVEHHPDYSAPAEHDEALPGVGSHGLADPDAVGHEDGLPGRHHQLGDDMGLANYAPGRGAFDRVGSFEV